MHCYHCLRVTCTAINYIHSCHNPPPFPPLPSSPLLFPPLHFSPLLSTSLLSSPLLSSCLLPSFPNRRERVHTTTMLCTTCAETPEEEVIITLHNYWCCVGNQMKYSQDHSHGCALGTSFHKVVDMNYIPSTNSVHGSRKLSTNMLTFHSSAYATPVVVQWN